jgi:type I restriction enzyme S subunit
MNAGLRAGYKLTDVGVIPEDWEVKRIGDIASVGSGGTPRREVPAYWGGSIPWVTTSQVDFGAISEAGQYITDEGLQNSPAKLLPPGTLLMALYGQGKTRGKVGVLAMEAATNQACASISLYQGVSREFVLHFLTSRYEQIRKSSNSGSQENLNGNIVKGLLIATPSPTEQRAIAAALSDVDALLAGLGRLIAKKRDLKQAAMQQLLTGQTRLPGFQGEWDWKRMGDVCRITTGKKDVNQGNPAGQYPFFTCARDNTFSDSFSFDSEAILIAGNGEVGNLSYFKGKFEAYQRTYVLQDFSVGVTFLWHQLTAYLAASLGIGTIGSSIPYIKKGNLVNFEFKAPLDHGEQTAIAQVLSDMDAELTALQARRDKTCALKQAMMQELLTGKTRLV